MKASEELNQYRFYNCVECRCSVGDDWDYKDFSNKNIVVCPQCKTEVYLDDLKQNGTFIDDSEKMRDFSEMSQEDFLLSYSYLTCEDYIKTFEDLKGLLE